MPPVPDLSLSNVPETYTYLCTLVATTPAQAAISVHRHHTLCSTWEDVGTQLSETAEQMQTPSHSLKSKVNLASPHLL